ncbi:MAG: hypothetical protein ACLQVL_23945 [Terriglobia bacterium]
MINRNTWPRAELLVAFCVCILALSSQALAQQLEQAPPVVSLQASAQFANGLDTAQDQPVPVNPPATPQNQPATPQTETKPSKHPATDQSKPTPNSQAPQNDRIFFALPNYLTVEQASKLPPLTTKQKFKAVAEGCFDPVEVAFIGIQSGLGQADNTNPTYGQGFLGYSKRFGTAYTDAIIGNFGTGAIFPSLLRQDPRYYQRGKGNFFYRFGYAAMRIVITRSDSTGKVQFNFSEFLGNGMAAGIANAYHPEPHTLASSTNVLGTQVVLDAAGYELKEFWPDIHRLLLHIHHKT